MLRLKTVKNFDHYMTTHDYANFTIVKSRTAADSSSIARSPVTASAASSVFAVTTVSEFTAV